MRAPAGATEPLSRPAESLQTPALSRVSGGRLWKMGQRPSLLPASRLPRVPKSIWLLPITEVQISSLPTRLSPFASSLSSHSFSPLFSLPPLPPSLSKGKHMKLLNPQPLSNLKIKQNGGWRGHRAWSLQEAWSAGWGGAFSVLCTSPPSTLISHSLVQPLFYVAKFSSLGLFLWSLYP